MAELLERLMCGSALPSLRTGRSAQNVSKELSHFLDFNPDELANFNEVLHSSCVGATELKYSIHEVSKWKWRSVLIVNRKNEIHGTNQAHWVDPNLTECSQCSIIVQHLAKCAV